MVQKTGCFLLNAVSPDQTTKALPLCSPRLRQPQHLQVCLEADDQIGAS